MKKSLGQNLQDRILNEIKEKTIQKQLPNLTEEQTLIKCFKYFDLDSSGKCSVRDWVKSLEKLGVFFRNVKEIQEFFSLYDIANTGYIDYREFASEVFSDRKNDQKSTQQNDPLRILNSTLVKKGPLGVLDLYKEFKIFDVSNIGKVSIDDFVKCMSSSKVGLEVNHVQGLFNLYEKQHSGYFLYERMFKDLKGIYWNSRREGFVEKAYDMLTISQGSIKLNGLLRYFRKDASYEEEQEIKKLINDLNFVSNLDNTKNLQKDFSIVFKDFFRLYGYGIADDEKFISKLKRDFKGLFDNEGLEEEYEEVNEPVITRSRTKAKENHLEDERSEEEVEHIERKPKQRNFQQVVKKDHKTEKAKKPIEHETPYLEEDPLLMKFKSKLSPMTRKSLISFMRYFQFFDNRTSYINKFDFVKVLKDFRLNLTLNEIETIFDNCADQRSQLLNHIDFLYNRVFTKLPKTIESALEEIYHLGRDLTRSDFTLETMRNFFNASDNPRKVDSDEYRKEFFESFENFHFNLKGFISSNITLGEFLEFYLLTGFCYGNDWGSLYETIESEWKRILLSRQSFEETKVERSVIPDVEQKRSFQKSSNPKSKAPKRNATEEKQLNEDHQINQINKRQRNRKITPLEILIEKLRTRGVRGLMHLHKQFLKEQNINRITIKDLKRILALQIIRIDEETIAELFEEYKQNERSFLDFQKFFSTMKQPLIGGRLTAVEDAFEVLDLERNGLVEVESIYLGFQLGSDEKTAMEFVDTFDLNFNHLVDYDQENDRRLVSFQEFANYYEYVSFLYDSDREFESYVMSSFRHC